MRERAVERRERIWERRTTSSEPPGWRRVMEVAVSEATMYHRVLNGFAVAAAGSENVTLLHDEEDPKHNFATALGEYLTELSSWK